MAGTCSTTRAPGREQAGEGGEDVVIALEVLEQRLDPR
jgi:hypothetical protein